MRLTQITLTGFKSFVDKTSIDLKSNIQAVVGPNGCGKSNIIDAVRWVLGESSAKSLRSDNSTDVIFRGSGKRAGAGFAQVDLTFDNSVKKSKHQYAQFDELVISKKLIKKATLTTESINKKFGALILWICFQARAWVQKVMQF